MSPCRRTRETAAPYLAAIEHFTGETPKQVAVWGLREQGGCVASNIEKETWDIPTIKGGTATGDRDLAWYCAGREKDLTTRGADNKEFLEALGSEIHARTGKGELSSTCVAQCSWLKNRYQRFGVHAS